MFPAALKSLNYASDRDSMSNQYLQPTTHQTRTDPYPMLSSLQTMDSKRKGCVSALPSLKEITYCTTETVAKVEKLSDLWKPGSMDASLPLVMSCKCN